MEKLSRFWIYCFLILFSLVPILFVEMPIWITLISIILIIFICTKFNIKKFPIIIFILSFLIRLIFNLLVDTQPVSDFGGLYNASKLLLNGNTSYNKLPYFISYPYQIGFVSYQTILLKICNSLLFLKIINCIISSLIVVLIYLISKEFVKEKNAQIVSIIYSLMPFTISYTSVLTNQHFSALLIYFALYILISKKFNIKTIYKYLIAGILIAVSNIIRPEAIITIVAIIIYIIFASKENVDKKYIKNQLIFIIKSAGTLLISYYSVLTLSNMIYINTGIAPKGLKNNNIYYKFVVGFNYESDGKYNIEDTKFLNDKEKSLSVIKERIFVNPNKIRMLFKNKINIFWNRTTLLWSFYNKYDKSAIIAGHAILLAPILTFLEQYNTYLNFILYILVIIGVFIKLKHKDIDKRILLLLNQVFITFVLYLLIEVQTRYAYFIQISIVILASLGIEYLLEKISFEVKRNEEKSKKRI